MTEAHYYPFGLALNGKWMTGGAEETKYRYNNKELNEDFGLNWLDYGARWHDASVTRWMAVDPLAEQMGSWSLYNYTLNNPVKFIDPNGKAPDDIIYLLWSPQKDKEGSSARSSGNITHHSAILIGDEENGWTFYSKSGGNDEDGNAIFETQEFESLEAFYEIFGQYSRYDAGLMVETTENQDIQMKETAESDLIKPMMVHQITMQIFVET